MWRDFVGGADAKTIWMVKKFVETASPVYYIPSLNNQTATTNEDKAMAFQAAFFPPPPGAD